MKTTVSTLHSPPLVSKLCALAIIIIPIRSKLAYANVSLKIFREDATDYPPITHSAGEDQDMSAAPPSGPSNTIDSRTQDASDLSQSLQPEAIAVSSVEDYWATAGKIVEETARPNDPSKWISKLIDGIDTVENVVDAFTDVSTFLAIKF